MIQFHDGIHINSFTLSRDSYRHPPQATAENVEISAALNDLKQERRRFSYRRIHDLLRPKYLGINHKLVYRLHSEANPAVRKCKRAKRFLSERVPLQIEQCVSAVWSMDNEDFFMLRYESESS